MGVTHEIDAPVGAAAKPWQREVVLAALLIGFGLLAFSSIPVLSAIGSTVGLGATMALVFSAIMSRPEPHAA